MKLLAQPRGLMAACASQVPRGNFGMRAIEPAVVRTPLRHQAGDPGSGNIISKEVQLVIGHGCLTLARTQYDAALRRSPPT